MGAFVAVEEMIVEKRPSPRIEKPWTTGMSSVSEILYVPCGMKTVPAPAASKAAWSAAVSSVKVAKLAP